MKEKIKKLLFEVSRDSRITTKELGKKIGSSQQSASYLKNTLKNDCLIGKGNVIVDAVKLGFVNVMVGFNYLRAENSLKREVIKELKEMDNIVSIEEGKEGVDILVEYSAKNLSAFNKAHSELIYKFFKRLKTRFVLPIIVNHEYFKNYLVRKFDDQDNILYGDRILRNLSEDEVMILNKLVSKPEDNMLNIADSLKIPVKKAIRIKKLLEKRNIIKGYGTILDNSSLEINRQMIFFNFSSEGIKQINKFAGYVKNNRNVVQFVKLIGEFQMAIVVESLKDVEIIKEIRSEFPIDDYLIMKSEKIHKKKYVPELE
jgi:DNA-binding Lrp family transcriptional regulator